VKWRDSESDNKKKCYTDQELMRTASQMAALFCMKWRCGRHLERVMSNQSQLIQLRSLIQIYVRNITAKFHTNPSWNDRASGFWRGGPNNKKKNNNNKMSSDMRSVPDLIMLKLNYLTTFPDYKITLHHSDNDPQKCGNMPNTQTEYNTPVIYTTQNRHTML